MKKLLILVVTLVSLASQGSFVSAQDTPEPAPAPAAAPTVPAEADQTQTTGGQESPTFRDPGEFGYNSPVRMVSIPDFIGRLISFALGIVGAILLATFVYAGGTWMTAGGDPKKVESAKMTLKNAVIGMMVVALSYTIVTAVFTLGNQVIEGVPEVQEDDTQVPGSGQSECPPGESLHPEQGCINRIW